MFPIRDHNPSQRIAVVMLAIIAANVLAFLVTLGHSGSNAALAAFYADWAMVPAEVTQGVDLHGLVTSMFLHGGFMHIAGNMLFLWIFGDNLEDAMGHLGFAAFYLAGGLAADLAHIAADPQSPVPTLGASGAIAAVMGGYLLLYPRAKVDVLIILGYFIRIVPMPAWVMLGVWFGLQVVSGAGTPTGGGGVAYWAHAGGFVAGLLLALPIWLRRGGPGYWTKTHGHPPHAGADYGRASVPVIRRRR